MALVLEPGCVVRRNNNNPTSIIAVGRNMIVTKVFTTYSVVMYVRPRKEYGYVFRTINNADLTVIVAADGTTDGSSSGGGNSGGGAPAGGVLDFTDPNNSALQTVI